MDMKYKRDRIHLGYTIQQNVIKFMITEYVTRIIKLVINNCDYYTLIGL